MPKQRSVKQRIRDVKRLLNKPGLPAPVRTANELKLAQYEEELAGKQVVEKTKKIAKKYHMVKFFERRKIVRKMNTTAKKLEEVKAQTCDKDEEKKARKKRKKELKARLASLHEDLQYVDHYPKEEPYIALFPSGETSAKSEVRSMEIREKILADIEAGLLVATTKDKEVTALSTDPQEKSAGQTAGEALADDPFFVQEGDEDYDDHEDMWKATALKKVTKKRKREEDSTPAKNKKKKKKSNKGAGASKRVQKTFSSDGEDE